MQPFFSVIITTFNRPQKLLRAIESVLNQSYSNYELIIVNDGSTRDYIDIEIYIKEYSGKVKYFFKKNEERSIARNFGVHNSSGSFVCFLDDDDYYFENHLEVLYNEIEKRNHEQALYHTYSKIINPDNTWSKYEIIPKPRNLTEQEYYLTGGIMTMNCSCFARKILTDFPYNPNFKMSEDSNQRLRALSKYKVYRIPEYTSVYDLTESSTQVHSLNNVLEYRKTWLASFKDPKIKPFIRKKIKTKVLTNHILLILNYHRLEVTWFDFFKFLSIYMYLSPSLISIKQSVKFTYRKMLKK